MKTVIKVKKYFRQNPFARETSKWEKKPVQGMFGLKKTVLKFSRCYSRPLLVTSSFDLFKAPECKCTIIYFGLLTMSTDIKNSYQLIKALYHCHQGAGFESCNLEF